MPKPLTLSKEALLKVYEQLGKATYETLTALDQLDHEDINDTTNHTAAIEGHLENASSILTDYHTNHKG